jgi:predicted flavoprotein YhiN
MNDQAMSVIRWALTVLGAWAASKGIISNADLSTLMAAILGIAGPAVMLATAIWGWYVHSHEAQIASVNALPGVKVVSENAPAVMVTAVPKGK